MNLRYRKKPIVIEAFQMTRERRASPEYWPRWLLNAWYSPRFSHGSLYPTDEGTGDGTLSVATRAGQRRVDWDDWIIRWENGDLGTCKPEIFSAKYEPSETES